jgi:hypothetical protein
LVTKSPSWPLHFEEKKYYKATKINTEKAKLWQKVQKLLNLIATRYIAPSCQVKKNQNILPYKKHAS